MKRFIFLFLLSAAVYAPAQQFIIGKVTTDADTNVPGVTVFNVRSDEMVQTDKDGHFIIRALIADELRFIRNNFGRVSVKVKADDFSKPLNVSIQQLPHLIEEVEIAFRPSGNLKKDVRALDKPTKVIELNRSLAGWMTIPPATAYPSNKLPSTIALGPDFNVGQISLISTGGGGLLGAFIGAVRRQTNGPKSPDYSEKDAFYKKVKETVDIQYFYDRGLDEYQFEMLVLYTDKKHGLVKNFRTNFNKNAVENYLKAELKEFMDTKISRTATPA